MNKKLFALIAILCPLAFFFSCSTDDNNIVIDEEWKAYNEKQVADIDKSVYQSRESESKNGTIYFKYIDDYDSEITKTASTKITDTQTPYFTDSVAYRCEGYFLQKDGTKYIFQNDNNGYILRGRVSDYIDGMRTMLQNMQKGKQVEVIIPYQLGYGTTDYYSTNANGTRYIAVPAYTTLRFKIYLIDIIPDNPGEFD
ncbi:FKBP-type peptidyl-prolyl cis-trans isomerase [Dysgonomonas sp. GY75]|uniref:FKBP-type peptidyl-prolyl cis-trans isomerase n=1 Tax=Dysgonomonas sp. GY75 TaxID=2780419 RepID=UPI0018834FEB|nr:FKBP-type peptidyl-prolyl cis-trans isomerase [Dysgonomonas sp. GY75]MBF0650629.1 FKBP-type peptidyl-prolyl cis-trans isomerase [Dysgonomonas sp. GY75]